MKRVPVLMGVLLLHLLLIAAAAATTIEPEVWTEMQGKGEASVIVVLKDEPLSPAGTSIAQQANYPDRQEMIKQVQAKVLGKLNIKKENKESWGISAAAPPDYDFQLLRQYRTVNSFSGDLTAAGLEKLKNDPAVEKIYFNHILQTDLSTSVPQINGNDIWNLSVGGYNITGKLETVCIIDTGIDTDHPAFQDKIRDQHCFCGGGCCGGGKSENTSAEDDHGHGTHVSGIAVGNLSTYIGVAKDAGVVAMKVCNASGSCATADVISGIEWCTNNATTYNISVISLSLGGGGPYNSYCNDDAVAAVINTAVGKNISVVVAAGNDGFTTGISSPACVQNATPVGAVNSADSISLNRGTILELLAPGISITSAALGGGTNSQSGTSMSAPHVSGAAALFRQYHRLAYGRTPSPEEIEHKFIITGKILEDTSSSQNYSRIDVLAALQPFINFTITSETNNSRISRTVAFINITSDVNLSTAQLEWSYTNGTFTNFSMNNTNRTSFYFNIIHLDDGTDTYRVYGNDSANTQGISSTRTIIIDATVPAVTISNPANGTNFSSGTPAFNATINEANIDTVQFSFSNATGIAFNITPGNTSGNWNTNLDLARLSEGRHTLTVLANDTAGNYNRSDFIDFTVDRSAPTISVNAPTTNQNFTVRSSNQTFNLTVRDLFLTVHTVLFSVDNFTGTNFNITAVNQSGYWVASYNVSTLAEGPHTVTIVANDTLGNVNNTETITFTIDNTPPAVTINNPLASRNFTFTSSNQTFNATVQDTNRTISAVLFSFTNASGQDFNITAINQSGYWTASYNVSTLANGSHTVTVFANDTAGNTNVTETVSFTIDVTTPSATLNSPANYLNTSTSTVTFNCSAADNALLANITLYGNWSSGWHANETKAVGGTANETTFSKTILDGTYVWNCVVADNESITALAATNFTLTVDSIAPTISAISSGTPSSSSATITWTTNEKANSTVNYGSSTALGTGSSSTSLTTSHSRTPSSLSASTTYYYNITSCDSSGNCNTNGTKSFTTAATSSGGDTGGSSGGGGGGGGGGGSSSTSITGTTDTGGEGSENSDGTEASGESSEGSGSSAETATEITAESPTETATYSETVSLRDGESSTLSINQANIPVSGIEIRSKVDKETTITFEYLPEKPAETTTLENTYQFFEITVDLTEEEMKRALVTFKVPTSWIVEHNFHEKTVRLNTFTDEEWEELPTEIVDRSETGITYQAKLEHFSYFAITAQSELELSWFRHLILPKAGSRGMVLFGTIIIIAFLLGLYWFLQRKEKRFKE